MTDEQRSQPPRPAARPTGIFLKHALSVLLLLVISLSTACRTKRSQPGVIGQQMPGTFGTNQNVVITPRYNTSGRVASVNPAGRFVILTFPLGTMPTQDKRLGVYRAGVKVGEIKVSGQPLDINIVADIIAGECRVGDEVREE